MENCNSKKISEIHAREILDSRGFPTVEAEVILVSGTVGRAAVPSGASTGSYEALELRDNDEKRYMGKGVLKAVDNVNTAISHILCGQEVNDIEKIDKIMIEADGTREKRVYGANAILAVSLACAEAAAIEEKKPLYKFIGGNNCNCKENFYDCEKIFKMPVPMMNIINGGRHAKNNLDFQEFMIMPIGADNFKKALQMGAEVYHSLKKVLDDKDMVTAVGDEGGFAPDVKNAEEALSFLTEAVKKAGYEPGKDIVYAMDAAASELYNKESGMYDFPGETAFLRQSENKKEFPDTQRLCVTRSSDELIQYYKKLSEKFPLVSIEDGLNEEDWEGWKKLTKELGDSIQLVGDDLFVTNTERLKKGIEYKCANAILIKLNQIGTLSETIAAIKMAQNAGFNVIVSHRSGETEDTKIADLAVALDCGQIKTGAPCRSERTSKYNRLLRIEEELQDKCVYTGKLK